MEPLPLSYQNPRIPDDSREIEAPSVIGIIPDGTRRWARQQGFPLHVAYLRTMELVVEVANYLYRRQTKALAIYLLSKENLQRNNDELQAVLAAEVQLVAELLPSMLGKHNCRVIHVGAPDILPENLRVHIERLCITTAMHSSCRLYLCIGYDSVREMSDALEGASFDVPWVKRLQMPEDIDLVIRTGNELRLSGFLPFQSRYAELMFIEKLWNSISISDIEECLANYQKRERRLGQ